MKCISATKDAQIVFEQNGKSVRFSNAGKREVEKGIVDGCLISDHRRRCDFFLRSADTAWLIELKGKDVGHALSQIVDTTHHIKHELKNRRIVAVVVTSRCPAISGRQKELSKLGGCNGAEKPELILRSRIAKINL